MYQARENFKKKVPGDDLETIVKLRINAGLELHQFRDGRKTVFLSKLMKYSTLNEGDHIDFFDFMDKYDVAVSKVNKYENVDELLESEDFRKIYPDCQSKEEAKEVINNLVEEGVSYSVIICVHVE